MKPIPKRRGRRFKLACLYLGFLVILSLAATALVEAGIRIFVPEKYWRFRVGQDDWQPDPVLGWMHKPNLDVESRGLGNDVIRFRTNPDGFLPAEARQEKLPGRPRIMLFGDSTVVGRAVQEDQRLARQLERALAAKGFNCEVICAGVAGYSTDQSLLMMRRWLPRYRPDVAIHMFSENDPAGNQTDLGYGLPKPLFTVEKDRGLTLHPPSPAAIRSRWAAAQSLRPRDLAQHLALYRMILPSVQRFRARFDWRERSLRGIDELNWLDAWLPQVDWNLFDAIISAMKQACEEDGTYFLLTQHPSVAEVWQEGAPTEKRYLLQKRLEETARKIGADFCPVVGYFLQARHEGPFHLLPRDSHCNAKGYEVTARCLAEHLTANPTALRRREEGRPASNPELSH